MISKKPIVLCILDGWGIGEDSNHNAIKNAQPKFFNKLLKEFPNTYLYTSGAYVGLPNGQMGNSEVGHMTIGSGRTIKQDLARINAELDSILLQSQINKLINDLQETKKSIHLIGLVSDGGVHSHINHLIKISKYLILRKIKIHLHIITDGRDTSPATSIHFIQHLTDTLQSNLVKISTISGRYFAMDRDNRFDRTEKAFNTICFGSNNSFTCPLKYITNSYQSGITDEFIKPGSHVSYKGIMDEDAVLFFNFRSDRMRQLCHALLNTSFTGFIRSGQPSFSQAFTMTSYSKELDQLANVIFTQRCHKNLLSDILHENGLSQLRIAETEKYAHVTFFFDAGREDCYPEEKRILVPSPKITSYDQHPEMSAHQITSSLFSEMKKNKYDFTLVNYANPDMVGHTGNYLATVQAIKEVDYCIKKLYDFIVLKMSGTLVITADHGNAECMIEEQSGTKWTAHTTNVVPFIVVHEDLQNNENARCQPGALADIAPTILNLFGIKKPCEMSGHNLFHLRRIDANV